MGQSPSRSNSQDAPKPETISGPMPLGSVNAGGVQTRTLSGEHNRARRDRRRSRDSTPGSPIAGSYTNLPSTRERSAGRRDSMSTVATAPPPYTAEPHRREVQLAEAPPPEILPRSPSPQSYGYQYPQDKKPLSFGQAGELQSHRRTVSHSILAGPSASRARALSPNSRRRMPSLVPSSVPTIPGGFRFDMPPPPATPEESRSESWHTAAESEVVSSPDSFGPETPIATRFEAESGTWNTGGTQTISKRRGSREDPLEMLRRYKTVMIVDDSSSMEGESWAEARDALAGLADAAAKYDQEGIDVHFLNDHRVGINMKNGVEVKRLFDHIHPNGITPTGEKLEQLLLAYMYRLETARDQGEEEFVKPVNFIVITDGAPTDDPESVIVATARRLDAGHFPLMQVGIQFVQIGTAEDTAEALRELDDGLAHQHGIRDMVDTTPYTGSEFNTELLVKILLGGINRRVDRHGATSVI